MIAAGAVPRCPARDFLTVLRRSRRKSRSTAQVAPSTPYSALASGYDVVMDHIDYDFWAAYVQRLIWAHHPDARRVLELGCGTGSLAFALQPMGPYRYLATDGSPEMIRVARAKADLLNARVRFAELDFGAFTLGETFDVVLLLHDGVNYLLEPDDVLRFLRACRDALAPHGILIFDLSTPNNSINNAAYFEDEGSAGAFSYVRRSAYDADRRLHTTEFDLVVEGESYFERHVQRAYTLGEIEALVDEAGLVVRAVLEDMTDDPADERAERVHWIVGRSDAEGA